MSCPVGWSELLADRSTGAHALALQALELALASPVPLKGLKKCFRQLARAHPAMAILENLQREVSQARFLRRLNAIKRDLARSNTEVAKNFDAQLRHWFPNQFDLTVVTFSHSSTVLAALAHGRRRILRLRVARSMPLDEGLAAARAARIKGLQATAFEDERLQEEVKRCDLVVVGADCILKDGSIVNKVGTRSLARICARQGKPFWAVASRYKFSRRIKVRLLQKVGKRSMKLFDVTPARWIDLLITEERPGKLQSKGRRDK